jgi:hypothetical protein
MVEQGFDEGNRLRYLVEEARKALEKVGMELSTLAVDGFPLQRTASSSGSATCNAPPILSNGFGALPQRWLERPTRAVRRKGRRIFWTSAPAMVG